MSNHTAHFDHTAGVRERLALLAAIGPDAKLIEQYRYNPSAGPSGRWYNNTHAGARHLDIKQEGQASLELIQTHWHMSRRAAMAYIGYPEKEQREP